MSIDRDAMREVLDRCRRMETRLTRFLELQGFDIGVRRPEWVEPGTIQVPSPSVALQACLAIVPLTWPPTQRIAIKCKQDLLAYLTPADEGVVYRAEPV